MAICKRTQLTIILKRTCCKVDNPVRERGHIVVRVQFMGGAWLCSRRGLIGNNFINKGSNSSNHLVKKYLNPVEPF